MHRRDILLAGTAAAIAGMLPANAAAFTQTFGGTNNGKIPLVHITDLYHPPQDPDDHIDLATAAALDEFDLKAVILDVTEKFLHASPEGFDIKRDPGFIPVAQLSYCLGRAIPVAAGPSRPLTSATDDISDRPHAEQAGVRLLLDVLEQSPAKVVVSLVGSARVLAAAYNRRPALLREKIRSVLLNAGSTGGVKREWNVGLDALAYETLWSSGLPIHWYPCSTEGGAFNPDHERGTYWKTSHAAIFRCLAPPLRAWFAYALSGDDRGDIIGALSEDVHVDRWNTILAQQRNMWATASLVMAAGRVLAYTAAGWRFVPASMITTERVWEWRLDRIATDCLPDASVHWHLTEGKTNALLFGRARGTEYAAAMADALAALLGSLA